MDGEFDRELDDGGRGIKGPYKPVEEQLSVMEKAVRTAYGTGKEAEDTMTQMRKDVKQILTDQGKYTKCTDPLLEAFWGQEKKAGQEQEEADKEVKTGNWLKKGKAKDRRDKASQDRKKWAKWALMWQGVKHLMVDNRGEKQQNIPPPYSPPQPTVGLYPLLDVKSGVVEVKGLGRNQGPSASPTEAERKGTEDHDGWDLRRMREEGGGKGRKGGYVKRSSKKSSGDSDSDGHVGGTGLSEWAKRELEWEREKKRKQWKLEKEEEKSEDKGGEKDTEQGRRKERERKTSSRHGTDTESEEEQNKEDGEVTLTLKGKWRPDKPHHNYYLRRQRGKIYDILPSSPSPVKGLHLGKKSEIGREETETDGEVEDKELEGEKQEGANFMGPLFRVGAQDKYRPFTMGDLQGLVDKTPSHN